MAKVWLSMRSTTSAAPASSLIRMYTASSVQRATQRFPRGENVSRTRACRWIFTPLLSLRDLGRARPRSGAKPWPNSLCLCIQVFGTVRHAGDKPNTMSLSGMLSIRNVDTSHNITVRSSRYYDTDGNLMREEKPPVILPPLATKSIFVPHSDTGKPRH